MCDCCYCSGRDSFIAVIDCLPSSPLSILVSLPFCKMWHAHFCNLSVCTSHFFIIPRSIDSSASSSAHAATRPLTPWQPSAKWRQAGSALSADWGALQQLLSRREKVKAADSGGGKKQITSFTVPTWGEEIKHPSAWLKTVIGRSNITSTRLVTINLFWFQSNVWF